VKNRYFILRLKNPDGTLQDKWIARLKKDNDPFTSDKFNIQVFSEDSADERLDTVLRFCRTYQVYLKSEDFEY